MRQHMFVIMLASMFMLFGSQAMALDAPEDLVVSVGETEVYFEWETVVGAAKYSVDVEFYAEGIEEFVQLSFGTSSRTDGGLMSDPNLKVNIGQFVYMTYDEEKGQLVENLYSGPVSAKVKALDPGKGKGSQNNPFSEECGFEL
jgi:hypothetical protein